MFPLPFPCIGYITLQLNFLMDGCFGLSQTAKLFSLMTQFNYLGSSKLQIDGSITSIIKKEFSKNRIYC